MKKNTQKGFTLVELLVVIAILAILASVAVVGYTSFIQKADDSAAESELNQVKTYVEAELMADSKWEFVVETKAEDGTITKTTYTFAKNANSNKYEAKKTVGEGKDADVTTITFNEMVKACADVNTVGGTFAVTADTITYTTSNGKGTATWTGDFAADPQKQ